MEIIPDAGHNLIYENPDSVNAVLYNFLVSDCEIKSFSIEAKIQRERDDPKWSLK